MHRTHVHVSLFVLLASVVATADGDLWTSAAELARIPTSGPAWEAVREAGDRDISRPRIWDQDDDTNVHALAAAIVYSRTSEAKYKRKVIAACEKLVAEGRPPGRTLAWGRELGAYVLAADLVGYRTPAWESWLRNMTEGYVAEEGRTLRQTFRVRPNNWGSHAFGTLAAVYAYLGDKAALSELREYWIRGVVGPNPGLRYDGDLSWHADRNDLRLINPPGAIKDGMNIDGVIPDDLRRGGAFRATPGHTGYPWEFLQGVLMAARILDRAGMPIWEVGDRAIHRAASALHVRFEQQYGGWAARGDDEWMLPFLDEAYGTNWSSEGAHARLWQYGKNAGFGYVTGRQARPAGATANRSHNPSASDKEKSSLSRH